jgi:hypothetical protein
MAALYENDLDSVTRHALRCLDDARSGAVETRDEERRGLASDGDRSIRRQITQ